MRRISDIVATTAAVAIAVPEYVLPWSPGSNTAATSVRAQHAPTGMPLPIALASVTTSGCTPASSKPNHRPVRPKPVWISSTISSAPTSSQSSRMPCRYSAVAGWTPPSPWIGSISTAATDPSTAARIASRSPHAT